MFSKREVLCSGEHHPAHCALVREVFPGSVNVLSQKIFFPNCLLLHLSALAAYITWSIREKIKSLCETRCLLIVNNAYLERICENSMDQLSSKDGFLSLVWAFRCLFLVDFCLNFVKKKKSGLSHCFIRSITVDLSRNKMLPSVELGFYSSFEVWSSQYQKMCIAKGQILMQEEDVQN